MQHAASAITAPDTDQLPVYWQFHEAVTRAQLTQWLPSGRHLLVDVSGPRAPGAELAARAGHTVLRVIEGSRATPAAPEAPRGPTVPPEGGPRAVLGGAEGVWGNGFPPGSGGSGGSPPRASTAPPHRPGDRRFIAADLPE